MRGWPGWSIVGPVFRDFLKLSLLLLLFGAKAWAVAGDTPLKDCAEIRTLTRDVAARRLPVRVRGVVTFCYTKKYGSFVLQTGDAGIYVDRSAAARDRGFVPEGWSWPDYVPPGSLVEVTGVTGAGYFSPVIYPQLINIVGTAPLPDATPVHISELLNAKWDCRRISVRGVVQIAEETAPEEVFRAWCDMAGTGGRVRVRINRKDPLTNVARLIDSEVAVTGVMLPFANNRGELIGGRIHCADGNDIRVMRPGPEDPFAVPEVQLSELQSFSPEGSTFHRRRCKGTVTLAWPGEVFYLQEGNRGVRVETRDWTPLSPGDRVEVSGFVGVTDQFGKLQEAVVRKIGTAPKPTPIPITGHRVFGSGWGATLKDPEDVDGRLATITARVEKVDVTDKEGPRLLVESEGRLITASFGRGVSPAVLSRFEPGSEVRINGVVRVELTYGWPAQEDPKPIDFRFLVPTPNDVTIIQTAPWWTLRRLWFLLGGIAVVLAVTLAWNWLLRRRVELRSAQLAEEMRARREAAVEFDATLRERQRLAADLHDTLEQSLTGIAFRLETMAVQRTKAQDNSEILDRVRQLLASIREDVRRSVWNLRSNTLEGHTLPEALQTIADRFATGHDLIVAVETEGQARALPDFIAGNLLLLALEALTNAMKHAAPRSVLMRVAFAEDEVALTVEDDGRGFDPAAVAGPREGHFGMQGMRERVKRIGGVLEVESAPGKGTHIAVRVPVRVVEPALVAVGK